MRVNAKPRAQLCEAIRAGPDRRARGRRDDNDCGTLSAVLTRRRFVIGALSTGAWACGRSARRALPAAADHPRCAER